MANEITVKVKGKDELSDTLDDVGRNAEKAGGKFKGFGDALGSTAKDKLAPFSDGLGKAGINLDDIGAKGALAGAAIVGLGGFIAGGVQKLDELVASTRQYKDAAGVSWEEASRLGGAFHQMGVEAEDGADVLKTLAEEAGDAPEKFKQFGVEITRTNTGAVDMTATLKNVADRFKEMRDPTQRAAMGAALFGDTWLKIAPMLERGGDGVQTLIDGVDDSRIVTDDTVRSQKKFQESMRDLTDNVGELQMALAKDLIPQLADSVGELANVIDKANDATQALGGLGNILEGFRTVAEPFKQWDKALWPLRNTLERLRDDGDEVETTFTDVATATAALGVAAAPAGRATMDLAAAEQEAAMKADILARRQGDLKRQADDATRAVTDQKRALDELNRTVTTIADANLAYQDAVDAVSDSQRDLADRAMEADQAVNTYGASSREAADAHEAYDDALRAAQRSVTAQARAEADLAQQQAIATGQTFTAAQYNLVYRDALNRVRDSVTDPSLRGGLDGLIGQVDRTAQTAWLAGQQLDAATAAAARLAAVSAGVGTTSSGRIIGSADRMDRLAGARAAGGPVLAGQSYLVGENGPEIFTPDSTGTIIPNGASGGPGSPVGGGDTYYVTVQALDGRGAAEAVTRALRDAKRYGLTGATI